MNIFKCKSCGETFLYHDEIRRHHCPSRGALLPQGTTEENFDYLFLATTNGAMGNDSSSDNSGSSSDSITGGGGEFGGGGAGSDY